MLKRLVSLTLVLACISLPLSLAQAQDGYRLGCGTRRLVGQDAQGPHDWRPLGRCL